MTCQDVHNVECLVTNFDGKGELPDVKAWEKKVLTKNEVALSLDVVDHFPILNS